MPSNFRVSGVDLDDIFQAGSGGSASNYKVSSADLNTRFAQFTGGTPASSTGFGISGIDINGRFAKKIAAGFSAVGATLNNSAAAPAITVAGMKFYADGTAEIQSSPSGGGMTTNWWTPTTGGIAVGKYVYCEVLSGQSPTTFLGSDAPGLWLDLNALGFGRQFFFRTDTTAPGSYDGSWRIHFSNDGVTSHHNVLFSFTAVQS